MGFLLGAFGKQTSGSYMRSLQARLMKINSRARRAARDVKHMEDMLNRQQKSMINSLQVQANTANMIAQQSLQSSMMGSFEGVDLKDSANQANYNKAASDFQQALSQVKAQNDIQLAMQKQQIEDYFEMLKETQLEPLKDEEEELQSEKDSLESQIQIAKQDYEACKEMEKDGAKQMKPDFTGGQ